MIHGRIASGHRESYADVAPPGPVASAGCAETLSQRGLAVATRVSTRSSSGWAAGRRGLPGRESVSVERGHTCHMTVKSPPTLVITNVPWSGSAGAAVPWGW